eukprot:2906862-Rhodomonas_salina.1
MASRPAAKSKANPRSLRTRSAGFLELGEAVAEEGRVERFPGSERGGERDRERDGEVSTALGCQRTRALAPVQDSRAQAEARYPEAGSIITTLELASLGVEVKTTEEAEELEVRAELTETMADGG